MKELKVPYSSENLLKCICKACPVQAKSRCAEERKKKMESLVKKKLKILPNPEDLAMLYCSIGKSSCKDINFNEACICPNCPVWMRHGLGGAHPRIYFCRDGNAQ